jgi:predicted ATPase
MADGITRIAVEGFKSISKKQSIEIAPLTILAGANSSGKSSIMQPLLMLKQTLESTFDPGPLKIDGPNVKFTSSQQLLSKRVMEPPRLEVAVDTRDLKFAVAFVPPGSDVGLEVEEETYGARGSSITLSPGMSSETIQRALDSFEPHKELASRPFVVRRNRFYLNLHDEPHHQLRFEYLSGYIQDVIHVPGLRGNPSRTYPATAAGPHFPATFEYYVASVIKSWQSERNGKAEALNNDLKHIGLTERVVARALTEVEIDLQVSRLVGRTDDMVSIADVGLGVSHTLPVLVALQVADEGRLVYIEQPEIHLHPRAQVKLADILANAAKRGVRVVAETHSTLLLTAIQTLVAKGELSPELVKLHWFQRDRKTGVTEVSSTDLDENGAFVQSDWPEDFDDVILKADGAYLDAVEGRQVR